jgi:hypothetical protein
MTVSKRSSRHQCVIDGYAAISETRKIVVFVLDSVTDERRAPPHEVVWAPQNFIRSSDLGDLSALKILNSSYHGEMFHPLR